MKRGSVKYICLFLIIGFISFSADEVLSRRERKETVVPAVAQKTLDKTFVGSDKETMSRQAAYNFVVKIRELLDNSEKMLVVFPTGRTPELFYKFLPDYINSIIGSDVWEKAVKDGSIKFANLDEYVFPIPEGTDESLRYPETLSEYIENFKKIFREKFGDDLVDIIVKQTYGYYMKQIYESLRIPDSAVYFINSLHENSEKAAEEYEEEVFKKSNEEGRKIIRVYGIGPAESTEEGEHDVHLAFLRGGTGFDEKNAHVSILPEVAKRQNVEVFKAIVEEAGYLWDEIDLEVPDKAITTGYPSEDDIVFVLVSGEHKALALYLIMSNEPTPKIPATYIHRIKDSGVYVDEAAWSMVEEIFLK